MVYKIDPSITITLLDERPSQKKNMFARSLTDSTVAPSDADNIISSKEADKAFVLSVQSIDFG